MKFERIALSVGAALALSSCYDTGSGEKVGSLTKLAKTGVFCKTWEAEIVRGGLNGGSGVMGAAFDFTIEDLRLVPQIQYALDHQLELRIHYRSELLTFCRSDSRDHFLVSVEFPKPGEIGVNQTSIAGQRNSEPNEPTRSQLINRILDQQQQLIDILKKNGTSR